MISNITTRLSAIVICLSLVLAVLSANLLSTARADTETRADPGNRAETEKNVNVFLPISIAFTFSMPPYLSNDMKSGIEHDIIWAAMDASGLELGQVHNIHYKRAIQLFEMGEIDGIVSNLSNHLYHKVKPKLYASEKTLDYVDCSITLAERKLSLASIDDYHYKSIWAFKTARTTLGPKFEAMANANPRYSENFDQQKQVEMLVYKRIDVAISDRNIFTANLKASPKYAQQKFEFQEIGAPTPRTLRLRHEEYVKRFNRGLAEIKGNGVYEKILQRYRSQYSPSCQ